MTDDMHSRRTREGLAEAAAHGRKPGRRSVVSDDEVRAAIPLGTAEGARAVGLSKTQFITRRRKIEQGEGNHGR